MAAKRTGISRDLMIHPGETIADILEERGITQAELAARTDVTPAYVSQVISGKKDISPDFARKLEYALDVPKTFWLNRQASYDAELLTAETKGGAESMLTLQEVIAKKMEDPAFKAEWDALEPEFQIVRELDEELAKAIIKRRGLK